MTMTMRSTISKLRMFAVLAVVSLTTVKVLAADADTNRPPVNIAIYGLVHGHARGFVPKVKSDPNVRLVGIIESDPKVIAAYAKQFKLGTNLFYPSFEALLAATN